LDRSVAPVSVPGAEHSGCGDVPEQPAELWRVHGGPAAPAACSAEAAADGVSPGPSVRQFQSEFIRSVVADALEEFREDVRRDIRNLHAEMVRQLHIQEVKNRVTGHCCLGSCSSAPPTVMMSVVWFGSIYLIYVACVRHHVL